MKELTRVEDNSSNWEIYNAFDQQNNEQNTLVINKTSAASAAVVMAETQQYLNTTLNPKLVTARLINEAELTSSQENFLVSSGIDNSAFQRLNLENALIAQTSIETKSETIVSANRILVASVSAETDNEPLGGTDELISPPTAGTLPPFKEKHAAAQGLQFSETKSACNLAKEAEKGEIYEFPDGKEWEVIDKDESSKSGYRAIVLKPTDEADKRVIIAYAGTSFGTMNDWTNNFKQNFGALPFVGGPPSQYKQGVELAEKYKEQYGQNVILTGHSLGGGIAGYASIETGLRATAINSAPLNGEIYSKSIHNDPTIKNRITQYYVKGEILTDLDNQSSNINRPGKFIEIPGSMSEKHSPKNPILRAFNNFVDFIIPFNVPDIPDDLIPGFNLAMNPYNFYVSVHNHSLDNLALDVPPPRNVTPTKTDS
jgi:hypothetical protein